VLDRLGYREVLPSQPTSIAECDIGENEALFAHSSAVGRRNALNSRYPEMDAPALSATMGQL